MKRKKFLPLLILSAALLLLVLSLAVGLAFFRPQMASLYRRVTSALAPRPSSSFKTYRDSDGKTVIWLDPGHGGADPGSISAFLGEETESTVNLKLCLLLREELISYGYTVKLTREENSVPDENGKFPYAKRYEEITSDNEADLYISIHCNSFDDPSVSGSRLYYYKDATDYNYYLASAVKKEIEALHKEDGPRLFPITEETSFASFRSSSLPSFLLETLFVSNEEDAGKLLDEEWLREEAKGIAAGIHRFVV